MTTVAGIISLLLMIIIPLAFMAGIIILQIYLSKRESKWPGLILPTISFTLSLLPVLAFLLFGIARATTIGTPQDFILAERNAIQRVEAYRLEEYRRITGNEPSMPVATPFPVATAYHLHDQGAITHSSSISIVATFFTLLYSILPTAVLLIIYAVCRSKRRTQLALNRMSLQDL